MSGSTPTLYGSTRTMPGGQFAMRVLGGKPLTLVFEQPGYLPVQRRVTIPDEGYVTVPEVHLTPVAAAATPALTTTTSGSGSSWQKLTGVTTPADSRPARTPRILVPPNTVISASGTPISGNLTFRMTEYTTSTDGLMSMPAVLPPTTAYTYATDFSIDGYSNVSFSKDLVVYVEDVVNVTPSGKNNASGLAVPSGYYDPQGGIWKASKDGIVIKVVDAVGSIDVTGDGLADSDPVLTSLGIDPAEKAQLTGMNQKVLWRVPLSHFSIYDFNYSFGINCTGGTCQIPPFLRALADRDCTGCAATESGSIITPANQTLGESLPVLGTPHSLMYSSDRVPGRTFENSQTIQLWSGTSPTSAGVLNVRFEATVAGQTFTKVWPAASAPSTYTFKWDGKDNVGRIVQGKQVATFRVGYEYATKYAASPKAAWDTFSFGKMGQELSGVQLLSNNSGQSSFVLWRDWTTTLGHLDVKQLGFGGWSLSTHQVLDPRNNILYSGAGTSSESTILGATISSQGRISGSENLRASAGVAPLADGSVVVVASLTGTTSALRRILPSGTVSSWPSASVPASSVRKVATARDGSVLVAGLSGTYDWRLYRVTDTTVTVLAGNCGASTNCGSTGDGGLATAATFGSIDAITQAPDGTIYVMDGKSVRRIDTIGRISTVLAGSTGTSSVLPVHGTVSGPNVDPMPMTAVSLYNMAPSLATDSMGRLYLVESTGENAYRLDNDGTLRHIGGGGPASLSSDGVDVFSTRFAGNHDSVIAVDRGDNVLVGSLSGVKFIDSQNRVQTLAGDVYDIASSSQGDGGLAYQAKLESVGSLAVGSNGVVYVAEGVSSYRVRAIKSTLPLANLGQFIVPSPDGQLLYVFDSTGRHLQTKDALSGTVLFLFGYDSKGRVNQITDEMGRIINIDRTTDVNKVAITGPDPSLSTTINLNSTTGWASSIDYPSVASGPLSAVVTHQSDGLLTSFKDLKGNEHTFQYTNGMLMKDLQPTSVGGSKTLARTTSTGSWQVDVTTAGNRKTSYTTKTNTNNSVSRDVKGWNGLVTSSSQTAVENGVSNGSTTTTYHPSGSSTNLYTVTNTQGPSARFGTTAPISRSTSLTTGSKSLTISAKEMVQTAGSDPLNPTEWCQATAIGAGNPELASCASSNAYSWKTFYGGTASARQITFSTPQLLSGSTRSTTMTLDDKGRLATASIPGADPITFAYDPITGRLISTTQFNRTVTYGYKDSTTGQLASIQPPAGTQSATLDSDAAGRVTQVNFSSSVSSPLKLPPDSNGNPTALQFLIGAGSPSYSFGYSAIDQSTSVVEPSLAATPGVTYSTGYTYSTDGLLELVTYTPSNSTIDPTYDSAGRLSTLAIGGTGARTLTATYNSFGQLYTFNQTTPASGPGLTFNYDGLLLSSVTSSIPGATNRTVSWGYDSQLRPTTESVDGVSVTYALDRDHSLLSVTPGGLAALSFDRDPASGVKTGSHLTVGGQTIDESISYEPHYGEMDTYNAQLNGSPLFSVATLLRDDAGRQWVRAEDGIGTTYTYDAAGRLIGSQTCAVTAINCKTTGNPRTSYGYDKLGNMISVRKYSGSGTLTSSASENYVYNAQNQLTSWTLGNPVTSSRSYTYTSEGRRTQQTGAGGTYIYTYSLNGELLSVTLPSTSVVSYTYDPMGRRVERKFNGVVTARWTYLDSLRPAAEYDGSNNLVARYVYGTRGNVPELMVRGSTVYRFITDERGSVIYVINMTTGATEQQTFYTAWGEIDSSTGLGFQPFGFAGGLYDSDTGLVHFGARDYDPITKQWMSKDPSGLAGGLNLYQYANSDPINYIDVNGNTPLLITVKAWSSFYGGIAGGAVGFASSAIVSGISNHGNINWNDVAAATLGGALYGAVLPYVNNPFIVGATSAGIQYGMSVGLNCNAKFSWTHLAVSMAAGGLLGVAGGKAVDKSDIVGTLGKPRLIQRGNDWFGYSDANVRSVSNVNGDLVWEAVQKGLFQGSIAGAAGNLPITTGWDSYRKFAQEEAQVPLEQRWRR